ncbi:MAG TPA: gephyrin-like molybdotransferase Glp [Dehalococcoidia bacterium]|nr:gephyrin-like molybdotransferase Glp [Dehalococcoidia bacterium]
MPQLFTVLTPKEAWLRLEPYLLPIERVERIPTNEALGRVLAEDIFAPENLPPFSRSAMDGYAVRAEDTHGASESLPAYLRIIGEIAMGRQTEITLSSGEVALVHTGSGLAGGADAVVMLENTRQIDASTLEVFRPVAVGENILQIGEDVLKGEKLLTSGHLIRPQDVGGLLALGITQVEVFQKVRVALISTGNELVTPESEPKPGQIRDTNAYTLSSLTLIAGGIPLPLGIVPDDYQALREAAERGRREADMVVISAGSSVSTRDLTAQVIDSLGKPGILVHGVSLKPGKPTILASVGQKPFFGLPGNPASAMLTFNLFVTPSIYKLSGCNNPPQPLNIQARLTRNIPSAPGREDYVPVRVEERNGEMWAEPIFGKSNLISTLIKADGLAQVGLNKAGLQAGEMVTVRMF